MLNCKQITQLASDSLEKKLSFGMRFQLAMHFAMCGLCSRFNRSIKKLDAEARACAHDVGQGKIDNVHLSDLTRVRIQQIIDSNQNE